MEIDHVLQTAKDAGGARVIEAFLSSNASGKQKHRLIMKYVLHSCWNICSFLFHFSEVQL